MAKKVLLIEDDEFLGKIILDKLQEEGYEAEVVENGKAGFERLKEMRPDLLLLDIVLPGMNGYEILEEKHKDESIARIPTVIVSNSGQPVEINRALELGVKDYIIKAQFEPDEVLSKVEKYIDKSDKEEEAEAPSDSQAAGLEGVHILSIEDDELIGSVLGRKLSSEGGKLEQAKSGEEGFDILDGLSDDDLPDIILLDIILPGMDGFDILEKLKADDRYKDIPVVLLSNLGQKEEIERGTDMGAEKFLVKATISLDEVIREVRTILDGQ